ncbi:MAG: hypothetical protein ACT4P0_04385 [Panacagrimonas sp.]
MGGCKLLSNASRRSAGQAGEDGKEDGAIAHMLDSHCRQSAGQDVDPLRQREQQIETLARNSRKVRD